MRSLILMIQFMTRYPVPVRVDFTSEYFVQGMQWMPVIGFLVGLPAAFAYWVLMPLIGAEPSTFLAVALLIVVTGGLHLDGIADSADGLFSYRPKEKILLIMRDPTIGTNGVIAIVLTILAKFIFLKQLPALEGACLLCCAPVLGRLACVWHSAVSGYARESSGMGAFVDRVGLAEALRATLSSLLLVTVLLFLTSLTLGKLVLFVLILHGTAIAVAILFACYLKGVIGGITGDTIGATIELSEIASFFLFFFFWSVAL